MALFNLNNIGGGGTSNSEEDFIFRPGGSAGGNVYTEFDALATAIEASTTPKQRIFVDMPGIFQTYTYTGSDLNLLDWSTVEVLNTSSTILPTLEFEAEITMDSIFGRIVGVTFDFSNITGPVTTVSSAFSFIELGSSANVRASNVGARSVSQPVVLVTGGGVQLFVSLQGQANVTASDYETIDLASGGLVEFSATDNSQIGDNVIRDDGSGTIAFRPSNIGSSIDNTQTNFSGTFSYPGRLGLATSNESSELDELFYDNVGSQWYSRKNNSTSGAPGASDDNTVGYEQFSRWIDTNTSTVYTCIDASTGAAVWV